MRRYLSSAAGFVLLATAGAAQGQSEPQFIQLDRTAAIDASINTETTLSRGYNSGGHGFLYVGRDPNSAARRRSFLKFDLSSVVVPVGYELSRVVLSLEVEGVPTTPVVSNFNLHRVLQHWEEGSVNGAPPVGDRGGVGGPCNGAGVTWNDASCPATPWLSFCDPGTEVCGTGGYYQAAPSAGVSSGVARGRLEWDSTVLGNEALFYDVAHWLATPSKNFGWMLKSDLEHVPRSVRRLLSSERDPNLSLRLEFERSPVSVPLAPGWLAALGAVAFGAIGMLRVRRRR